MYLVNGILHNEGKMEINEIYNLDIDSNLTLLNDGVISGIEVDEIHTPNVFVRGKVNVHYINPTTKEQWFELVDRPLTQEENIEVIDEKVNLILQMQMSMQGVI